MCRQDELEETSAQFARFEVWGWSGCIGVCCFIFHGWCSGLGGQRVSLAAFAMKRLLRFMKGGIIPIDGIIRAFQRHCSGGWQRYCAMQQRAVKAMSCSL